MYLRPLPIGDRKKLPEYRKQAGDGAEQVAAPKKKATPKERIAAAPSGSDGGELSSSESDVAAEDWKDDRTGGVGNSDPEEWSDDELDISEEDALSGDADRGMDDVEEGAAELDPPVLDKVELDDEVAGVLGEAAKHVPKKKRWADWLRRPLRPKRARKRKNVTDDDDDSGDDESGSDSGSDGDGRRRKSDDDRSRSLSDDDGSGTDTDEDTSESDSDDEDRRVRRRRKSNRDEM
jgi:hypothetical protein